VAINFSALSNGAARVTPHEVRRFDRTAFVDRGGEPAKAEAAKPRLPVVVTIAQSLGAPVYFCDSRSPWQRGSNENTNGLLRDYFPKGTDLSTHSTQHLLAVENELNNRPRLVLNDRAPAQLFATLLASLKPSMLDVD
jgi:IS30 family transposase